VRAYRSVIRDEIQMGRHNLSFIGAFHFVLDNASPYFAYDH